MIKIWKRIIGAAFLISLMANIHGASAHATPVLYSPAASSLLQASPSLISIDFSERVEPRVSGIAVFGPDGSKVNLDGAPGLASPDPADQRRLTIGIKDGGEGSYTVSWHVISADDGHFTKGAYIFSVKSASPVGAGNASEEFQIVHSSSIPEAAAISLEMIGEAILLGSFIVLAFIWRPTKKYSGRIGAAEDAIFSRRFNLAVIGGFVLVLLGGISYLIYKANDLSYLQETSFQEAFSSFLSTTAALYTIYRMVGAALVVGIFEFRKKSIFASHKIIETEWVIFIVLALIDLARAKVSHAAASNFAPDFSVAVNFIHLFFKDIWIGGLFAMLFLLSPIVRRIKSINMAAFCLTSFSTVANVSFAIAGVTGVYVVWLHLKSFSNVLITDWGKTFIALSIFAAILLGLRLFHEFYIEPKLTKGKLNWLHATLMLEAAAGIIVLGITSLMIITTPPIERNYSFLRETVSQNVKIELTEAPYDDGQFLLTFADTQSGAARSVINPSVTLTNSEQGIGPISAPLKQIFYGGYLFPMSLLSPAGNWKVDISAEQEKAYNAVTSFKLNYPTEIKASNANSEKRSFGIFEMVNVITAMFIFAAAGYLYKRSSKLQAGYRGQLESAAEDGPREGGSEITFVNRDSWVILLIFAAITLTSWFGGHAAHGSVLISGFERECENFNILDIWHESAPERAGKATSDISVPGCTLGVGLGQYHFADEREFKYFIRPSEASATLDVSPKTIQPGVPAILTFKFKDKQGNPVQDLVIDHDRILHAVIVNSDFSSFSHVHVEDAGPVTPEMLKTATFPVRYTFPAAGYYMVSVDFTVRAQIFSFQFYENIGHVADIPKPADNFSDVQVLKGNFDGYDVTLNTSKLNSNYSSVLDYHIEKDGQPVTDLNPYLAVPMHISLIRDDLGAFKHTHGLLPVSFIGQLLGETIHQSHLYLPDKFGPDIEAANFKFPTPGNYYIFGEFRHNGRIIVTKFPVKVQ